jgi:hypothetical protein
MAGVEGGADPRLIAAHHALHASGDVQFKLTRMPDPPPTPEWLKAFGHWLKSVLAPVGRALNWIGSLMPDAPYARIPLWTVIVALVLLLTWVVYNRLRYGEWRMPQLRRRKFAATADVEAVEEDWAPEAAPAREWLSEADRLAGEGRYGEAVHHLLLRSVEDIARRRPQLVRPALTSRDLARAAGIPLAPRRLFADLAAVVERSLFGGAAVGSDDWDACRTAYADFTKARSWQA